MAEFSEGDFPNFSLSLGIFNKTNANERFPSLREEEATDQRKQNKNTFRTTKTWLNVFNEWKVQRKEDRNFEDIPVNELDAILCRFFAEIRKKDSDEYEQERLAVMQCSLDKLPLLLPLLL